MLGYGASQNIMPKIIMEQLGLEITKPYNDIYSFGSSKFKFMGMIKDLVVTLAQLPTKSIMMDVVVIGVQSKYVCSSLEARRYHADGHEFYYCTNDCR